MKILRSQTILVLFICFFIGVFLSLSANTFDSIEAPFSSMDGRNIRIEVDLKKQLVKVFKDNNLIKEMFCSTGKEDTPTPTGSFETYEKVENNRWIEPNGNIISYYYFTKCNGHFGFHSKIVGDSPFVQEGERNFENRKPSSLGCIRLLLSDAKWLFEEVGLGAKVEVY